MFYSYRWSFFCTTQRLISHKQTSVSVICASTRYILCYFCPDYYLHSQDGRQKRELSLELKLTHARTTANTNSYTQTLLSLNTQCTLIFKIRISIDYFYLNSLIVGRSWQPLWSASTVADECRSCFSPCAGLDMLHHFSTPCSSCQLVLALTWLYGTDMTIHTV